MNDSSDHYCTAKELMQSMKQPNPLPHVMSLWGQLAHQLAIEGDAWDDTQAFAEEHEALAVAGIAALLDLATAVRQVAGQLPSVAQLLESAPTAEALAVLMRAVQTDQHIDNAWSSQS